MPSQDCLNIRLSDYFEARERGAPEEAAGASAEAAAESASEEAAADEAAGYDEAR